MKDLQNIIKSFHLQENLNSKIWKDSGGEPKMESKVREKLLEIANEFIEYLNVDIIVSDVIMTGSLANYNWSEYSDIDLHVVADFTQFPKEDLPLYEELFKLKKTLFNEKHNIKIYGYEVELYVQNEEESHFSSGVYSVLTNEWLTKPKKEKVTIDTELVKSKVKEWMNKIDTVIQNVENEPLERAKVLIDKLKDKIKKYRTSGLQKGGEYSDENLVFKSLRRNGYIEKLFDYQIKHTDKELSLNEMKLDSPIGPTSVNSPFGSRWGRKHHGVDLSAKSGTKVFSPFDGVVSDAEIRKNACGGTLVIKHPDGIKTRYCHLKEINVKKGDTVKKGDLVALTGGAKGDIGRGRSDGAHLHLELYINGKLVNPQDYLDKDVQILSNQSDDEIQTKIELAKKSTFLEGLKKIAEENKEYKNLKKSGQKIPYQKEVEFIQTALQFLGFSLPKWGVDGLFGNETEEATKNFQKQYNLNSNGIFDTKSLKYLYAVLLTKDFSDDDLVKIQKKSDFSQINVGNDKQFYEEILKGIGAPITDENLKFFYAWRKSEGGKATNNPFNTTMRLQSDINKTDYNKVGVKNYTTPQYGVEATVKTLLNGRYSCIVNGLKNDIGAKEISKCSDLKTWGTGDLVTKVINSGKVNPPPIYA